MGGSARGFTAVDISICSAITAKDRYPNTDETYQFRFQPWRNNLTALSHYRNLYFVAHGSEIHVYKPHFPSQSLQSDKVFKLHLPQSAPGLTGYINPDYPHAVNHLAIGDLGNAEALVCACDDGDVIAYFTRSIARALEKWETDSACTSSMAADTHPFFQKNVGASAWGIAMHKAARILAISANTHQISVFAFALGSGSSPDGDSSGGPADVSQTTDRPLGSSVGFHQPDTTSRAVPDRSQNREIVLSGHDTNVPNITFCNNEDDPDGRYLISIDIHGVIVIWQIWEGIWRKFGTHDICKVYGIPQSHEASGWSVLCLDPRSFRPAKTDLEFLGCRPQPIGPPGDVKGAIIRSEDSTNLHPISRPKPADSGRSPSTGYQRSRAPISEVIEEYEEEEVEDSANQEDLTPFGRDISPQLSISFRMHRTSNPAEPNECPFLLFSTTNHDLLLWSPTLSNPGAFLRASQTQHIPEPYTFLRHFERLNMSAQIPELGILIVAAQTGRVAILTLTRTKAVERYCAFRTDWIVPFRSQEKEGKRPAVPLLGIAVGPIQGHLLPEEGVREDSPGSGERVSGKQRRWRLMLTYFDQSVLSYEIGRASGTGADGDDGGAILVF